MKSRQRRDVLKTATALLVGGAASQAMPSLGADAPKTPFNVAATFIPIAGMSEMFPVRRIYCIGRNYAAHSREMGSDPTREPPFFFQKPTDAIQWVPPGETIDHPYPPLTKNYHYEIELVAALHQGGRNIPIDRALEHVFGYTVGLDMTRRDLQRAMGDEKKPILKQINERIFVGVRMGGMGVAIGSAVGEKLAALTYSRERVY